MGQFYRVCVLGAALLAARCDAPTSNPDGGPVGTSPDGAVPSADGAPPGIDAQPQGDAAGSSAARALAMKLRGKPGFMVGMGNDLNNNHDQDGAYTLGVTMDLHYAYLVGLMGQGGWTDWNANGTFVDILAQSADKHGTTPMFTLYSMAAWGENNLGVLTNDAYMKPYWDGAKLLFQRLGAFGKPAVVHLEPDFWGFAQQASPDAKKAVHVKALAPDCAALSDDLVGMGHCFTALRDKYAPKVALGFHVSSWAGMDPQIVSFMKAVGADKADYFATDALDRDAGCFEAHTDPNCMRGGTTGWYWDESNQTSPNFHEHFAWVKKMSDALGLPAMWWQVPFGVPSSTPGGTAGHYRDNRVHYFFSHVAELAAAGGFAMVYGTGAGNQTYITTDNGQFKSAVTGYFASPFSL